jgi:hypothetical protein
MTAADLMNEMLGEVRRRFFPRETQKRWSQEQGIIRQAITYPARYLEDRGASLPEDRYRKLVLHIFRDIHTHIPNPDKIGRMSYYLLHAVQRHMQHQGDRYYEIAKTPRAAAAVAKQALAGLEVGDSVTPELAKANAVLAAHVQRRCKPAAETQQDLFKGPAKR